MNRKIFSAYTKIQRLVEWYGDLYRFERDILNEYNEPTGETDFVQLVPAIYHRSSHDFVELIQSDGGTVKAKVNKGLLCGKAQKPSVQQNDKVRVNDILHFVTAVEPVLFGEEAIAWEISLEEVVA